MEVLVPYHEVPNLQRRFCSLLEAESVANCEPLKLSAYNQQDDYFRLHYDDALMGEINREDAR